MPTFAVEALSTPVSRVLEAYREGRSALLLTGRSLDDFVAVRRDGEDVLTVLRASLRCELREAHGVHLVSYSRATGLDWNESSLEEADQDAVRGLLRQHRLLDIPQDEHELERVMRGVSTLVRTPSVGLCWAASERPLRIAFLFEFAEHLVPGGLAAGTETPEQLVSIELSRMMADSLALRSSRNLVIFHGRQSQISGTLAGALHHVRLAQPDEREKREVMAILRSMYPQAQLESDLDDARIAHLSANTPNRGLEELVRAAQYSVRPLTGLQISIQKNQDVETLSDGTLRVLDTARAAELRLTGLHAKKPMEVMRRLGEGLRMGDPATPANVLLVGGPGTGKTDLAVLTAAVAGVSAYQMFSPKAGIVGETERRASLQQQVLREWTPNIAFMDEVTEALPLERQEGDHDAGASRAVTAALLTALSDESRRGRSMLITTTNCPWRMGAAMASRFTVVPVLHPLAQDYPTIIGAVAAAIEPTAAIDVTDERVREAGRIFSRKWANPRHIRVALSNVKLRRPRLDEDAALAAAHDFCGSTHPESAIYADLWAIESCTSLSFLPWTENPSEYPCPEHLDGLIARDGRVNRDGLRERLREYQRHANL